jgi:DinB superfamily
MDKERLIEKLNKTTHDLLEMISAYNEEQFNTVPFEGSWTAGQVCDHLFKAEGGMPQLITGATEMTERDPGEKAKPIDDIFLDFSTKLKSPDFILPGNGPHSQSAYYNKFQNNRSSLKNLAETIDLTETCTAFEMPVMGHLTRYELLRFVVAHSARHIHQLKNIRAHL